MVILKEKLFELEEDEQVDIDTWQDHLKQHSLTCKRGMFIEHLLSASFFTNVLIWFYGQHWKQVVLAHFVDGETEV